jgi:hypothetical protein
MVNFPLEQFWPWLRVERPDVPAGFWVGVDDSGPGTVETAFGLSNWRPPEAGASPQLPPFGFRMSPEGSIRAPSTSDVDAIGFDSRVQHRDPITPFVGRPLAPSAGSLFEPPLERQPWWSRSEETGANERHPEVRWPWLRDEARVQGPGFPVGREPLPYDAIPPPVDQSSYSPGASLDVAPRAEVEPPDAVAAISDSPRLDAGALGMISAAIPIEWVAQGRAASEVGREALSRMTALAGRAAPAAMGIAGATAAALPLLVIPTNRGEDIIPLGERLRARRLYQSREVEIERRAADGLFGTDFGARWEKLPVEAEQSEYGDVLINHRQLEKAIGSEAAAQVWDANGSAMARPPRKPDEIQSPTVVGGSSSQAPGPGKGPNPPTGPNALTTAVEVGVEALKRAKGARTYTETDAEFVRSCEQIMKAYREQAPDGQYRGEGGFDTAIGVRMHPKMPDPKAGRDHYPEHQSHRSGVIGEHELANRVTAARPNDVIVHFGNPAGLQGPDVISVGPDPMVLMWESKWRTAELSIGPSSAPKRRGKAVEIEERQVRESIQEAMDSGRLSAEVGEEALRKYEQKTFAVCTVGTGNAHNGVIELFRGGVRSIYRRKK